MHENTACRPQYYIKDTLIKVRKYEGAWLPITWNYAVEFFWSDAQEKDARVSFILSNAAHYTVSSVSLCSKTLKYIQSNKLTDCRKQKEVVKTSSLSFDAVNKPIFFHLYRLAHQISCAIRASRTNKREKESKSVKSHFSKKTSPFSPEDNLTTSLQKTNP